MTVITVMLMNESVTSAFPSKLNSNFSDSLKGIVESVGQQIKMPFSSDQTNPIQKKTVNDVIRLSSSIEARTFYVPPSQAGNIFASSFQTVIRLGSGVFVEGYRVSIEEKNDTFYSIAKLGDYQVKETCSPSLTNLARPQPIEIYEFEGCPFCRKVREAVSILSLKVLYKPCPKDGATFRKEIKETYGRDATFPFMVDPNTGTKMFESDDIISYLFGMYGDGVVPAQLLGPAAPITAAIGLLPRFGKGSTVKPSNLPNEPLTLWAYEGSPFCKIVREELCELEIPHIQISTPRGSPYRQQMLDEIGRFQVPYLEDPNEGISLFESEAILEYIQKKYGIAQSPVEYF